MPEGLGEEGLGWPTFQVHPGHPARDFWAGAQALMFHTPGRASPWPRKNFTLNIFNQGDDVNIPSQGDFKLNESKKF